ncbi:hypothetical protein FHS57_006016 [Runella defluvii]|uniref:Uncharacterized protein n=1 Tax=Runella defluvii TaxID=370973 RepID=A0A7W5ZQW1_9BACT|nr:hypothetical protein [Runella defluvii]MBB3841987.1 hypothetical protein [Runella defluvii]
MSQEELEKLIYVKHPNKQIRQNQIEALEKSPVDQFDFLVLLFNFGNASYRYMSLAKGEETMEDFEDWLEGLPDNARQVFEKQGFEAAKTAWPFRRHVMERRDLGMDEYIQKLLRPDDWEKWNDSKKSSEDGQ